MSILKDANLRTLVARVEYQRLLYKAILQDRVYPNLFDMSLQVQQSSQKFPFEKKPCYDWAW